MKNKKNLQEKINNLDEIIKYFEESNKEFDLDEGLTKYDEAMNIVQTVKKELQAYELKINEIHAKYGDSEE
jgi:exodeoxyribonuclease VII small subunit